MLQSFPITDSLSVEAPAADRTIAVYDTAAAQAVSVQTESASERAMLSQDKLPVVLAVVLIVWAALMILAFRTDRRLAHIERALDAADPTHPGSGR